jgi:VWFA-related protein
VRAALRDNCIEREWLISLFFGGRDMSLKVLSRLSVLTLVSILVLSPSYYARGPEKTGDGSQVTILVTAVPHNERSKELADKLQPGDFVVTENGVRQQISSVKPATQAPPVIAVLIQDDLVSRVNNEIRDLKEFIRSLPDGSRVMTGYLTVGDLAVAQDFTSDRQRAADSLRIIRSSQSASPYNPYIGVMAAIKRMDSQPPGRRIVLLISDGLDTSRGFRSASPALSFDLDRAIRQAQRSGVTIFGFYAPSIGLTSVDWLAVNYGQGSLSRIADETGGVAFFTGTDFVSFNPYITKLSSMLSHQWVVTYKSTSTGKDFRRIEVTTDFDIHLAYPPGYRPK